MRIYIAAPYPLRDIAQALRLKFIEWGHTVTSRWITESDALGHEYAMKDLQDLTAADCLYAYNPEGWGDKGTGGRHVEFGYALALGMPILLDGPRTHLFHHLEHVGQVGVPGTLHPRAALSIVETNTKYPGMGRTLMAARTELMKALDKHGPMHSAHEGKSVIEEELDELWDHVKADTAWTPEAGKEALQIAAMGMRFHLDIVGKVTKGRG